MMAQQGFDGKDKTATIIKMDKCELEGPYKCPYCNGHFMIDGAFLNQVENYVSCPYCISIIEIPGKPGMKNNPNLKGLPFLVEPGNNCPKDKVPVQ